MRHLKNYHCVDEADRSLFVNPNATIIAKTLGITENELFQKTISFHKKLAKSLNVSEDFVIAIILKKFNKSLSDLIEFSACGKEEQLYKEKAVYTIKCDKSTHYQTIKNYHNVYVVEKEYNYLIGTDVAECILNYKYPHIFKNPNFIKVVNRFQEDSKIFELTPKTKLKDVESILMKEKGIDYFDYTIQDLLDVLTNPHEFKKTKEESLFLIYAQGYDKEYVSIYLELDNKISLTIPIKALQYNDWSIIEEAEVFNIPCYPNERRWYTGKQKDAPYFNHPLILKLKELFGK